MSFTVIIPARFASTRLPGKPLKDIAGKPMIQHVYEQACKSAARDVIIATDDERIKAVAEGFGARVCLTRADHESGTDRLQEVVAQLGYGDDEVIVNVQGDEPLIPPSNINQVAQLLLNSPHAGIATLSERIDNVADVFDPNAVKVVSNAANSALYFSRAPLPWVRDNFNAVAGKGGGKLPDQLPVGVDFQRHIGIYGYRVGLLHQFVTWAPAPLELAESLEQLRAMWNGVDIKVAQAVEAPPPGVDTEADLERVRALLA